MDVNEKPSELPYDESQSLLVYYFSFITGGYIVSWKLKEQEDNGSLGYYHSQ